MSCPLVLRAAACMAVALMATPSMAAVNFVGVPGSGTGPNGNTFAFEDPANWDAGTGELEPPGSDSIWFAENNTQDITLVLSDPRTGEQALGDYNGDGVTSLADYNLWRDNLGSNVALPNDNGIGGTIGQAHYDLWKANFGAQTSLKMGTFAYGGEAEDGAAGDLNTKFTLVLNASVTLTAQEWNAEGPRPPGVRSLRLGRANFNPVHAADGGTTEDFGWGLLVHNAGTLQYDEGLGNGMDFSRDKVNSAGALYQISGDAVLNINGPIRFGDRDNGGSRTTPGGIFRVVGSNATLNVDDFLNESRLGLWDHDNNVDSDNPNGVTRMNLGKFVTEFVLDAGGASPINVADELRLGRTEDLDGNREIGYAFLRLKLSEPTTAGSGAVGSGDEIVLFRADRISSAIDLDNDPNVETGEIEMGRFFDPDRAGLNTSGTSMLPHAGLWDGSLVTADYAGAQYQWTINYFDSSDDGTLVDAVTLSNLNIVGTPGDLSGNGTLGAEDRQALVTAIASPPSIAIATAQNLYDLNADEVVDNLDLALFDTYFSVPGALATSQVPEPASVSIVVLAAAGLLAAKRRSRA